MLLEKFLFSGRWLKLLAVLAAVCAPRLCPAEPASGEGWEEIEHKPALTVYLRPHAGSSIKESRAVGIFDAPNWVVKNVLDDVENYPSFMPYVVESKLLWRNVAKRQQCVYARLNPPLVDPRDYTLLVHDDSHKDGEGTVVYASHWEPANVRGPAERSGTVRVNVNEGSWLLEPIDGGEHTRGTYTLYTDGGGGIPSMLFNSLSKRRINELFEAIARQVKDAKYQKTKPVTPP
jgi:hypothetical protein